MCLGPWANLLRCLTCKVHRLRALGFGGQGSGIAVAVGFKEVQSKACCPLFSQVGLGFKKDLMKVGLGIPETKTLHL